MPVIERNTAVVDSVRYSHRLKSKPRDGRGRLFCACEQPSTGHFCRITKCLGTRAKEVISLTYTCTFTEDRFGFSKTHRFVDTTFLSYEVNISRLSKEDTVKQQLQAIKNNKNNSIIIYTNASSTATKERTAIGIGTAVTTLPSIHIYHERKINIGPDNLVYNGEFKGATVAVEYAAWIAKPGLNFHIYSDNQAGLWRLKPPSDNPGQAFQICAIQATKHATD